MFTHNLVLQDERIHLDNTLPHLSLCYAPNSVAGNTTLHDVGGSDAMPSDSSDGDDGNNLEALIETPLQLGQTLIIYHPHAQHPPDIVDTTTLSLTHKPQSPSFLTTPWAPFASRDDFEQAELFIKHNCTNQLINDQLHLNQKGDSHDHHPDNLPLMKNARDLHRILEEAESCLDISSVSQVHLHPLGSMNIDEE